MTVAAGTRAGGGARRWDAVIVGASAAVFGVGAIVIGYALHRRQAK